MKVFIDEEEYDMIEAALIVYGRLDISPQEKDTLTKIMQKLRAVHQLSKHRTISMEPLR